MVKLSARPKAAPKAAIRSTKGRKPDALTYEGGAGFSREPKSELFLLAVTNMVGEKTFYEDPKDRDARFEGLIRQVALEDPDWLARFVPYLRDTMNMRSASIVMAAELVHAKLTKPVPASSVRNRDIIASAIRRADEPAEMLGYWMSQWGKALPMPVKRGVADAVVRLYNERNLIKYDGGDHPIRFGDVIDLVHPEPKAPWQSHLFGFALDARHKREDAKGKLDGLSTIQANQDAMVLDQNAFRERFSADYVENAGLTWEQASSKYGKLDAKFWEAMIPNMGIFAIVRNLRNFDDVGISAVAKQTVLAKLMDVETIRKSRMFPLRFYTAMGAVATYNWAVGLETAINTSLDNVPSLKGRSLILVDLSGSMDSTLSDRSKAKRYEVASLFGAALALRAEGADLVGYSNEGKYIHFRPGQSLLMLAKEVEQAVPHGGTETWRCVEATFKGHDRVIILTDEQAFYGGSHESVPEATPLYTFNLAGYRVGHAPSGKKNRYTFGGLSDAAFTALELLERGSDADWPF